MDQCATHSGTIVNVWRQNGSMRRHEDGMSRLVLDVALLTPLESQGGSGSLVVISLLILCGVESAATYQRRCPQRRSDVPPSERVDAVTHVFIALRKKVSHVGVCTYPYVYCQWQSRFLLIPTGLTSYQDRTIECV